MTTKKATANNKSTHTRKAAANTVGKKTKSKTGKMKGKHKSINHAGGSALKLSGMPMVLFDYMD